MAGLKKKYKGVVLLESLVALIIILICMGIATTIFVNVISANNIRLRLSAYNTLKKIAHESNRNQDFIDATIKTDALTIYKRISINEGNNNLLILQLKAVDNNLSTVATYNEMILK